MLRAQPLARPIRILQLVQGLEIGGLEQMVITLVERLDPVRFKPAVCCFDVLGALVVQLTAKDIPVDFLPRKPGLDLSYPLRLARFLRRKKIDILHLHNPTALFYGTLAGRIARTPAIIYTEHGRDFSSSWKVKLANRWLSALVNEVVAVAERGKTYLTSEEGFDSSRIKLIYNGIDADKFNSWVCHDKRREMLATLGLKPDDPIVGVVARLDPIKNHASLLKAMVTVSQRVPGAMLLVIGDGPLRLELEQQAQELRLGETVKFLGARSDVPELLSILDVFVLPSYNEGLSLTLIEACAVGKPIVATDVGGNSEVVEHGINGLLVPSDNPHALAKAITHILADKEATRRMGQIARERFEKYFTADAMVASYELLYDGCFSRGK
ncbi:glycosyltransferase [Nitrosococcus wardiae]|nr:glycosyltransferase [Nitrosococcus wardiae]